MNGRNPRTYWIGGALLLATIFVAGWTSIAETLAIGALERAGFGPVVLKIGSLTPWRLEATNVSLAGGRYRAGTVRAHYRPDELLDRRVRSIEIEDPFIQVTPDVATEASEKPAAAAEPSEPQPQPRIDHLVLRRGSATWSLPGGDVAASFDGEWSPSEAGVISGRAEIKASGAGLSLDGNWAGTVDPSNPLAWLGLAIVDASAKDVLVPGLADKLNGRFRLRLEGNAQGLAFDVDGKGSLAAARGEVRLEGQLEASDDGSIGQDFSVPVLRLAVENFSTNGMSVNAAAELLDAAGPIAVAGGRFRFSASAARESDSAPIEAANFESDGAWRLDGMSLSLDPSAVNLSVEDARLQPGARIVDAIKAKLVPNPVRPPQINLVFDRGGSVTLAPQLELSVDPITAWPDGASISLPLAPFTIGGFASLSGGDSRLEITGGLERAMRLYSKVVGSATGWQVTSEMSAASGRKIGNLDVALPQSSPWRATFKTEQMVFGPGQIAWSEVFGPLLDLRAVAGSIDLGLTLSPDDDGFAGTLALKTSQLGFDWADTKFENVGAQVALERIWPPQSKTGQTISFSRIGAALPVEQGVITFDFPGGEDLRLERVAAELAGGSLEGGDAIIHLGPTPSQTVLNVRNVDLGKLLSGAALDGLEGVGTVGGSLPIHIEDGSIFVRNGELAANSGSLRYRPATPSAALQAGGAIVGQALANFQYESLKATVNGDVMEDLKIGLALKGKNPDLMKGYPVEFNVNLEGPLGRIAANSLSAYRIPEAILDQIPVTGAGVTTQPQ